MNGVTGRMGTHQHLERSILAIRDQGGIVLPDGETLMPEPVLVGRNLAKLAALAEAHGITQFSTDLEACLADPHNIIYFDALSTLQREDGVRRAIMAGKHIYCEKPVAASLDVALELASLAESHGVKHGVVQDKLFLPGFRKLKRLLDRQALGRILAVRGEFGYWVFDGVDQASQRPSWNYRHDQGGGITLDMLSHWQYLLEHLFGTIEAVQCLAVTHVPVRYDIETGPYTATADDAAYATFQLAGGVVAHFNSSWCVRVNRDELFEIQVDGTEGSAVAGLRHCKIQERAKTPRAVWNPDVEDTHRYRDEWSEVADEEPFDNAFKVQWELFLRHVVSDTPFPHSLFDGAKGVQLAELGAASSERLAWMPVPSLGTRTAEVSHGG